MAGKWSTGEYQQAAPRIRAAARENPDYVCPYCGKTYAEAVNDGMRWPDWVCGHPEPPYTTRYAAWHGTCNARHGAIKGNNANEPHTERW